MRSSILPQCELGHSSKHAHCQKHMKRVYHVRVGRFDFDNGKPRANFDNFWTAFLSMFQVASQQNWPYVMFDSMRVAGKVSRCYQESLAKAAISIFACALLTRTSSLFRQICHDEATAQGLYSRWKC
jgi:Ion transport protein